MVTRLQIARPDIVASFEKGPKVLRLSDISAKLEEQRDFWRLAQSTSLKKFIEFLVSKTELRVVQFPFAKRPISGYTWGNVSLLESLQVLADGYFTHYTAVRVHGLTEQVPKEIYITSERRHDYWPSDEKREPFAQEAIDQAFQQPPRVSHNECTVNGLRLVHLAGTYHGAEGVTVERLNLGAEGEISVRVTGIERTLIDITVRPFYAGGVFEVLKAFENAKTLESLSVNRMGAMVQRMAFGYPYHQAIGFYLERAGYRSSLVDIFRRMPRERDFYLTHQMGATDYKKEWRLHVPKGF